MKVETIYYPRIIAEIGCNHKGDMEIAHEMIKSLGVMGAVSSASKIDVVKFQKRTNRVLLSPEEYNAPHPNPANSYGATYGLHREALEFSAEQHRQLKEWCEAEGMIYSASVWDLTASREIIALAPALIKVPSACNLDFDLLAELRDNYGGEIHLSFGMTTKDEEKKIVGFFKEKDRAKDLVVYACTSGYPVPFEDICLFEIKRLRETFGNEVKTIGFSGHHLGIAADIAALTLGATHFERHYTLDRTWKGTDHAASLEWTGMQKLARDLRVTALSLTAKSEDILDIEKVQRKKLKREAEE
jgi:N-acetylneuraminate synthase